MHTLELTDEQLVLLHSSLNTWINSFSHDEPDLLRAGKALRAKLEHEQSLPGTASTATTGSGTDRPRFAQ